MRASTAVVVITDTNVWRWHGARLLRALAAAAVPTPLVKILPPGEHTKTRAFKEQVEDWMLENKCVRGVGARRLGPARARAGGEPRPRVFSRESSVPGSEKTSTLPSPLLLRGDRAAASGPRRTHSAVSDMPARWKGSRCTRV